jgi:GntR family transcriptional regulator, transcriptional repressor for pyruvate dehydrogenase complex
MAMAGRSIAAGGALHVATPRTRAELLAELVEAEISEEGLEAGDRIGTKDDLRRRASVAHATVNQAVRLLESRGVIEVRPGAHGGLFVAQRSPAVRLGEKLIALRGRAIEPGHAMVVRDALEGAVVDEALRSRSEEDVRRLRELLGEMESCLGDPELFLRKNWRLHRAIAQAGANDVLSTLYLGLMDIIEEEARMIEGRDDPHQRLPIHVEMVEAIAERDAGRAARAVSAHGLVA